MKKTVSLRSFLDSLADENVLHLGTVHLSLAGSESSIGIMLEKYTQRYLL